MSVKHPLRLVAPWYHWERQYVASTQQVDPRISRPVIQKFDKPDPVTGFVADPQRSLVVVDQDWVYDRTEWGASDDAPDGATLLEKLVRSVLTRSNTRKLFQAAHARFYLVVCELHCDAPGLPDASSDKVTEMGFVIRRSSFTYRDEDAEQVEPLLEQMGRARAGLQAVVASKPRTSRLKRKLRIGGSESQIVEAFEASRQVTMATQLQEIARLRGELRELMTENGARTVPQAWIASDFDGIGSWTEVEAAPPEVDERVYPLQALVPDPSDEDHSSIGATLLFGLIPLSSADTDSFGAPHLDDQSTYHLRCFVRQRGDSDACPGPLVWSEPTEGFRIASHADLAGTSNRAITIKLPDLKELAAATAAGHQGPGGVRMMTPPASQLSFKSDVSGLSDADTSVGGQGWQICSFSIPLITIIATFVLSIFLPIVVFIFQLYWMLLLKFCIPPSIGFDVSADLGLDIEGDFDFDVDFELDVDIELGTAGELLELLTQGAGMDPDMKDEDGNAIEPEVPAGMDAQQVAQLILQREKQVRLLEAAAAASAGETDPEDVHESASLVAGLEFEPRLYMRPDVSEFPPQREMAS